MKVFEDPKEMQEWSLALRKKHETLVFVPTMGFLHEGHCSLMREARTLGDKSVLSIFVNPTQFGPKEDLTQYPRDKAGDFAKAKACGVDVLFYPSPETIYPEGHQTTVQVEELSKPLCGASRIGHFRGVATIVLKLFNIVQPHIALFGEKDFQQLRVIQQMVKDLHIPVTIRSMPIVREADGLAMSSRNRYLSDAERKAALAISQSLAKIQSLANQGESDISKLLHTVQATQQETKKIVIDYVKICDPETLEDLKILKRPALLAIACHVGKTRLIDNCLLR